MKKSPARVLLPTPNTLKVHQKGDNNGESVENEDSEGTLKYT